MQSGEPLATVSWLQVTVEIRHVSVMELRPLTVIGMAEVGNEGAILGL